MVGCPGAAGQARAGGAGMVRESPRRLYLKPMHPGEVRCDGHSRTIPTRTGQVPCDARPRSCRLEHAPRSRPPLRTRSMPRAAGPVTRYFSAETRPAGGPWAPSFRSALWVHDRIPWCPKIPTRHRDDRPRRNRKSKGCKGFLAGAGSAMTTGPNAGSQLAPAPAVERALAGAIRPSGLRDSLSGAAFVSTPGWSDASTATIAVPYATQKRQLRAARAGDEP